jgi:hypothetical protein
MHMHAYIDTFAVETADTVLDLNFKAVKSFLQPEVRGRRYNVFSVEVTTCSGHFVESFGRKGSEVTKTFPMNR